VETDRRLCTKCKGMKPLAHFHADNRTCNRCRTTNHAHHVKYKAKLKAIRDAARAARQAAQPAVAVQATVRDYPRIYRVLGESYCEEARRAYDAMHVEMLAREWMVGADKRINWCVRHECNARDTCDECLTEAVAWQHAHRPEKTYTERDHHGKSESIDQEPRRFAPSKANRGWKSFGFAPMEQELTIARD
jgi:hypothetical protein